MCLPVILWPHYDMLTEAMINLVPQGPLLLAPSRTRFTNVYLASAVLPVTHYIDCSKAIVRLHLSS